MPIHVTTSTTQSLSNKTFVDRLSTTGIVYANGGNSDNWNSVYSTFNTQSAGNASTYTTVNSKSANWDSVYSSFNTQSAANASVYSTVQSNSASWGGGGTIDTDVRALTSNWQNTYTDFSLQSSANTAVYSTVNANSATAFTRATIGITIDGGGSAITTGSKGYISVPYSCTINNNTIVADQAGSIVIDVKKSTYAGFPTTTSICAAAKPTIVAPNQKSTDSTLTGWTTTVTSGDIIEFVVDSAATITKATLTLGVTKT